MKIISGLPNCMILRPTPIAPVNSKGKRNMRLDTSIPGKPSSTLNGHTS